MESHRSVLEVTKQELEKAKLKSLKSYCSIGQPGSGAGRHLSLGFRRGQRELEWKALKGPSGFGANWHH